MKVECMIHTCESDAEVIEVSMCSLIKVQVHVRQKYKLHILTSITSASALQV